MKKTNKLIHYRGKDCIEKACKIIKECSMEIINHEKKKEMIPLTHEENNFCNKQEICYMCKEKFCMDKDDKNYINKRKVKDHCHYTGKFIGAAHNICNLNDNDQKEIPVKEFNGELNCIGDNMEKYITFSVPIKKEVSNYDSNEGKKKKKNYLQT